MTVAPGLHPEMTMAEILERFPGARRALFQKYHIGGCSSCGFQPEDTLTRVLANHHIDDVQSAITTIHQFDEMDRRLQVAPQQVVELRRTSPATRLIDVRSEEEHEVARIEGAELLDEDLFDELRSLPRDTPIVFHCHHGIRSLDMAAYFAGHGFTAVRSMTGGIDAWSASVDARVPRY